MTKDEWYALRDDRTQRIEGLDLSHIHNFTVGVVVSEKIKDDIHIHLMTELSLNMLARWCRNITIEIPEVSIFDGSTPLEYGAKLIEIVREIDPYGNFAIGHVEENNHSIILNVGLKIDREGKYLWIDSLGWLAGSGYGNTHEYDFVNISFNPIGACFAACLGVSEILKYATTGISLPKYSKWYSLIDYQCGISTKGLKNGGFDDTFDFGVIHQIGAGAVGSSLLYLFSLTNWKGKLHLIDFDQVSIPNCSSSLAFKANDAIRNSPKVLIAEQILKGCEIDFIPYPNSDFDQFIRDGHYESNPPDLILCLANERNIWSTIQNNYPPIVFHATTNSSWGTNFGRHIPLAEWCILCRFQEMLDTTFKPICGVGEIQIKEGEKILGSLPFLSPASAIVLFSEIAKLAMPEYKTSNNFHPFNFKPQGGGVFLSQFKSPQNECKVCGHQHKLYHNFVSKTKFWSPSTV